ncbi:MAG: YdcF family protein [Proteobacteria bacterium]|nr:YdcF family protein [Pseudomonadota bacterium]
MSQFTVVKMAGLLAEPLTQALLLLFVGLFLILRGRRRAATLAFVVSALWLWLASTSMVANFLMSQLEHDYPPVAAQNLPHADAIVLLGGAIRGEVSEDTLADMSGVGDRLIFAVAAFKAGRAPAIVVTGGAKEGFVPEARLMRDILVTLGVPSGAIVMEVRNRVTMDNNRFTRHTLAAMEAKSVLLVTSAFHMRRSLLVFDSLDIEVVPAPTDFQVVKGEFSLWHFLPDVKALQRTTWAMHEFAGYLYYSALKSAFFGEIP